MTTRFAALALIALAPALASATPIDTDKAAAAIAQANRLCAADDGRLWGLSLCGPILIADGETHEAIASRQSAENDLLADGAIFRGKLPDSVTVANTALDWSGTHWIVLRSPLPDDTEVRGRLLMHESWHRIQDRLGLPLASPTVKHLDTRDGRIRLRLEWRALAAALGAADASTRKTAIADALAFRAWRRELASDAEAEENALELNEGLAEYTGYVLCGAKSPASDVIADLQRAEASDSFVRSFAYHSGPAYGLLLDRARPGWRRRVRADSDLGRMLALVSGASTPADSATAGAKALERYRGNDIIESETARDNAHRERLAAWKSTLVDRPVLVLPFFDMHIAFDPNALSAMPPYGTVYPTVRLTDRWGVLDVARGALIDDGWSKVQVGVTSPPGHGRRIAGDGWTLELAEGWTIIAGARAGDFTLAPPPSQ